MYVPQQDPNIQSILHNCQCSGLTCLNTDDVFVIFVSTILNENDNSKKITAQFHMENDAKLHNYKVQAIS